MLAGVGRFIVDRNKVGGFCFSFGEITAKEELRGKKKKKYNRKPEMALSKGCRTNEAL